ncbi:hypothetical protein ScalyP_jg3664 [Parmales sp. scaly parma]|nr:hypothetical protein ScalyP_jg3664 [Parmales sp. scaly parma]
MRFEIGGEREEREVEVKGEGEVKEVQKEEVEGEATAAAAAAIAAADDTTAVTKDSLLRALEDGVNNIGIQPGEEDEEDEEDDDDGEIDSNIDHWGAGVAGRPNNDGADEDEDEDEDSDLDDMADFFTREGRRAT